MSAIELVPYLPELVVEWVVRSPTVTQRHIDGTVVYVDISGFTRLSERLARRGKIGAEEVAETIGECFRQLLAIAYADGAGLLKFGGDALLLWFTGHDHAVRACRSAVGMRRRLGEVGKLDVLGKRIVLRMSVGVHSGTFGFYLVGDTHRELIVAGPAATTTVEMESTAEAGDIVVSHATAAALPTVALGARKGTGLLVRRMATGLDYGYEPRVVVSAEIDLSRCIPEQLRSLLASEHEPEHRRSTVAFLKFTGVDAIVAEHGTDEVARRLDTLVTAVQHASIRHDVTFLGTDVDRDGGKIILTAGVPHTAGDDEQRMLLAMRDVVETDVGLRVQIGVNRGDVFAGDIGPDFRRTYTVMGDAVNLAARVMGKATPGEVLATLPVLERTTASFETTALEPFLVKGKSQPVHAARVGPVRATHRRRADSDIPISGRESELAILSDAAASAAAGNGRLVELVGDPGLGKSRLLQEFCSRCIDMRQLTMVCEPYTATTPYEPFRNFLFDLLALSPTSPDEVTRAQICDALGSVSVALVVWAPLVAAMLNVPMDETPETSALAEHFRPARLGEVVSRLLGHRLATPTLLVVEDTHWMDDASSALLASLSEDVSTRPWLLCIARRDEPTGFAASASTALSLHLRPLDSSAAARLIDEATSAAPISPHDATALVERAGGNPLFLKELIDTLRFGQNVDALPDSVEAVIATRIDRLATRDRNLLRRASILGRSFSRRQLGAVLDDVPAPNDPVWNRLDDYLQVDGDRVRFEHALVRDSAYDGLPYRLRRELHGRVADLIRADATDPDDEAELLSLHYFYAQRRPEAYAYSRTAATWARGVYANVEATEFYQRAFDVGRELDVARVELGEVAEALGDMHDRTGNYADAQTAYSTARRLLADDAVSEARLLLKLSRVHGLMDRFTRALRWITRGLRRLDGVAGAPAARQRAQLRAWYGHFSQDAGRHATAIKWCRLAMEEADAAGDKDAMAHALRILDWANMDLGRLEAPVNLLRALSLYEELGDLAGAGGVLNMLGGIAYWRGQWPEALDYYSRAETIVVRTGNTAFQANCRNNIGEILVGQGHLDDARACFEQARRIWRAAGYRSGICAASSNLAQVLTMQGELDAARGLFDEALAEARVSEDQMETIETSTRLAEFLLVGRDPEAALARADDTLTLARALGGVAPQTPVLQRVRGVAAFQLGDATTAAAALDESLEAAARRDARFEVGLSLRAKARLVLPAEDPEHAKHIAESDAVFAVLGVVAVLDWSAERGAVLTTL